MKTSSQKKIRSSSIVSTSSAEEEATHKSTHDSKKKRHLEMNEGNANSLRKRTSLRRFGSRYKPPPTRSFVEHHYHDHSRDPIAKPVNLVGPRSDNNVMSRSFPEKLHFLLDTMAEEGLENIASWQPHGRCFVIHDKEEFVASIMQRFFMQTKLTSFQRQLNLYGELSQVIFCDQSEGLEGNGYFSHPVRILKLQNRFHSFDGRTRSWRVSGSPAIVYLSRGTMPCRKANSLTHHQMHMRSYYHEYFLRGRADLCRFMIRTRVKGIGMKAASSPATEPNFYKYKPCPAEGLNEAEKDEYGDDDESVASNTLETSEISSSSFDDSVPNIVSPPESPVMSSSTIVQVSPDFLPASCLLEMAAEEIQSMPHTGDEVFFEGLKFRYLDHLDLDDVQDDINVANVEYL